MYSSKLNFKTNNVHIQIQNKRRRQHLNGMWGAPVKFQGNTDLVGNQDNYRMENFNPQQHPELIKSQNQGLTQSNVSQKLQNPQISPIKKQNWGNDLTGLDWVKEQNKRQNFKIISAGQNINEICESQNLVQNQITFLQPSPALKKLQYIQRYGRQFYDERFPPNNTSLFGQSGYHKDWQLIRWKKLSQILPTSKIFSDRVQPSDIKQGLIGDCYLLAALGALAERPDRIFNLFLLKESNNVKYYSVKILYKGKWITIDMDQNIPVQGSQPAFSRSIDNQIWVILLEKAWAKLYSSYNRIDSGYPEEGLHDLTGAPIRQFYTFSNNFDKQEAWRYLMMASQKEYAMIANTGPGSDTQTSKLNIVLAHAYILLNATIINYNGLSQRIVQLRNPWRDVQYKGRWNDKDPNWKKVSESERRRLGYLNQPNDGMFFMPYDEFIKQFTGITIAQINDNASYVYKSAIDRSVQGAFFKVKILKTGYYSFHIDQTPWRSFENAIYKFNQYPLATLQLGYRVGNYYQKVQTKTSKKRTLFRGYNMYPGDYIVFAKIDFNRQYEKDYAVNLAVYSQYACTIDFATYEEAKAFSGNPRVHWDPRESQNSQIVWNSLGNSVYRNGYHGWSDSSWTYDDDFDNKNNKNNSIGNINNNIKFQYHNSNTNLNINDNNNNNIRISYPSSPQGQKITWNDPK